MVHSRFSSEAMRSTAEVAQLLGVSTRTVQNLLARGELCGVRVGRQWRIPPEELARFLASEKDEPPASPKGASAAAREVERAWLTVTEAAALLMTDVSGITFHQAKARVSKAATEARFRTNGRRGRDRRIDRDSFSTWRLEQRERDLARYE